MARRTKRSGGHGRHGKGVVSDPMSKAAKKAKRRQKSEAAGDGGAGPIPGQLDIYGEEVKAA